MRVGISKGLDCSGCLEFNAAGLHEGGHKGEPHEGGS